MENSINIDEINLTLQFLIGATPIALMIFCCIYSGIEDVRDAIRERKQKHE